MQQTVPSVGMVQENLSRMQELLKKDEENYQAILEATTHKANWIIFGLTVVILAAGISGGVWFVQSITKPLKELLVYSRKFGEGDLTVELTIDRQDEVGEIASSLKESAARLNGIVSHIRTTADNVATESQELSASAEELSQGATE
ncbi:MAG: hypothetical protein A2511_17040 [Deltaproteobacteria bacterium RIFOXYD12_FULL_50_9]|nr:MAG: hypothetical protein A2511_17040 [Deltaproteobacteria bacterium RIFOXYD12_FULL_50_9]